MTDLPTKGAAVSKAKKPVDALPKPLTIEDIKVAEMTAEAALASAARSGVKVDQLKLEITRLKARHSKEKKALLERLDVALARADDAENLALGESMRRTQELAHRDKTAPHLAIVESHAKGEKPILGCVCVACRLMVGTKDLRERNKKLKADLKGFQGPRGKGKK